jgi:hypothetical protein
MRTWKEYKEVGMITEAVAIKTIEGAIDYALENSKNKKEALALVKDSKDNFIIKNAKKINDMLNKLPNSMF